VFNLQEAEAVERSKAYSVSKAAVKAASREHWLNSRLEEIGMARERDPEDSQANPEGSKPRKLSAMPKKKKNQYYSEMTARIDAEELDVLGTLLSDFTVEAEKRAQVGQFVSSNPADIPWILMAFPVLPLAIMYTYTIVMALWPVLSIIGFLLIWVGWKFYLALLLGGLIGILAGWPAIKQVPMLYPATIPVQKALHNAWVFFEEEIEGKAIKDLEKPIASALELLREIDKLFFKAKYGFLLEEALPAWMHNFQWCPAKVKADFSFAPEKMVEDATEEELQREISLREEVIYHVEFRCEKIEGVHSPKYRVVWMEWHDTDGHIEDMTEPFNVLNENGETFVRMNSVDIDHEVNLPYNAKHGEFRDKPITLVLKAANRIPVYTNEGTRLFPKNTKVYDLGSSTISAKKIGAGKKQDNQYDEVKAKLRIPFFQKGFKNYTSCYLLCEASIERVPMVSYSCVSQKDFPSGDWTVFIHVHEIRFLRAVDASGTSDPFVEVTALGKVRQTKVFPRTISCIVDEMVYMENEMTGEEISDDSIVVRVMDHNTGSPSVEIGTLVFDTDQTYSSGGFEKKWFVVTDRRGRKGGFINLTMRAAGPGEELPLSVERERFHSDDNKLLKSLTLERPLVSTSDFGVHVVVGWAEMLPAVTLNEPKDIVRAYCTLSLTGYNDIRTQTQIAPAQRIIDPDLGKDVITRKSRRVIWCEEFIIPLRVINGQILEEGFTLKLYHRSTLPSVEPQLIGDVPIQFEELMTYNGTCIVRGQEKDNELRGDRIVPRVSLVRPRYYNFYGTPLPNGAPDQHSKDVSFNGRLLVGVAAKPERVTQPYSRPAPVPNHTPTTFYSLSLQLFRITALPHNEGTLEIEAQFGIYSFGYTIGSVNIENFSAEWSNKGRLHLENLQFPAYLEEIPDLLITVWYQSPSGKNISKRSLPFSIAHRHDDEDEDADLSKDSEADGPKPGAHAGQKKAPGDTDHTEESYDRDATWTRLAFMSLPANHLILKDKPPFWRVLDDPQTKEFAPERASCSLLYACDLERSPPPATHALSALVPDEATSESRVELIEAKQPVAPKHQDTGDEKADKEAAAKKKISPFRDVSKDRRNSFGITALVLKGIDIPTARFVKNSVTTFEVLVGDKNKLSQTLSETPMPLWNEEVTLNEATHRELDKIPNVYLRIFDIDYSSSSRGQKQSTSRIGERIEIGCCIIPYFMCQSDPVTLADVRSFPVFLRTAVKVIGELQCAVQLDMLDEKADESDDDDALKEESKDNFKGLIRLSLVGLHGVKFLRYPRASVYLQFTLIDAKSMDDNTFHHRSKIVPVSNFGRFYEGDCNLLDVLLVDIELPDSENREQLSPSLNVSLFVQYSDQQAAQELAYSNISLVDIQSAMNISDISRDKYGLDHRAKPIKFVEEVKNKKEDGEGETEADEDLIVLGYPEKKGDVKKKEGLSVGEKIQNALATAKYNSFDKACDLFSGSFPDLALHLGFPEPSELKLIGGDPLEKESEASGVVVLEMIRTRGVCHGLLEKHLKTPAFGCFKLYRGSAMKQTHISGDILADKEVIDDEVKLIEVAEEKLEIGKLKMRMDLVDIDKTQDKAEYDSYVQKARLTSLLNFNSVFKFGEIILVRVYVARALKLQQHGVTCNPYLRVTFFGGHPQVLSTKLTPKLNTNHPEFYQMFQSEVMMPGGSLKIEVKDREIPSVELPVPFMRKKPTIEGRDLGVSWHEDIGETTIDLDERWYNKHWRSLEPKPLEIRPLELGNNEHGSIECVVEIIPASISNLSFTPVTLPMRTRYQLRLVVFKITDVDLPYKQAKPGTAVLANFYVRARLGNNVSDALETDVCNYSPDGTAEFQWRMYWWITLPDTYMKPRLKLQIYDKKMFGADSLCGTVDVQLGSMFDQIVRTRERIDKKQQWLQLGHPKDPDVRCRIQVALEFIPEREVGARKCKFGAESRSKKQFRDYVLPQPFRPAKFSLLNPAPFFNYAILTAVYQIQWQVATFALVFPFLPMVAQLAWLTPPTWYFAGGCAGLVFMLRLVLVDLARQAPAAGLDNDDSDEEL